MKPGPFYVGDCPLFIRAQCPDLISAELDHAYACAAFDATTPMVCANDPLRVDDYRRTVYLTGHAWAGLP